MYMVFTDFGESLGLGQSYEGAKAFKEWLEQDLDRMEEYMPDTDIATVKSLHIDVAV